ncbi:MAG: PadR family transcriptional regulator [Nocardia sp.]|nr:PadR family transcriptional regulator [Nocardia sp.]
MARKRKVDNLLALAVLTTLVERPMHRYEMATQMRERGKDRDMDIKWGSLYTVVRNLEKHEFVEVVGNEREGARPERTIYRITEAGRAEARDWVRELLCTHQPEHHRFVAGLSVAGLLPPQEVIALLDERLRRLDAEISLRSGELEELSGAIPRLFLIEAEYGVAMLEAEAAWVTSLRAELASGTFPDIDIWQRIHTENIPPDRMAELMKGGQPHQPDAG